MNAPFQRTSSDYALRVEPLAGVVRAMRGDTVIAESENARLMVETRLPPTVYFPRQDVRIDLTATSDAHTFCPFKGTASYGHVRIDGETVENGWWTYADALPEAKDIEGMIAFMPDAVTGHDLGGNTLPSDHMTAISGPLVDWMLREAGQCPSPLALTKQFAERLLADGIAVSRLSIMIWSLHPMIAGRNYVWTKETGEASEYAPSYDIHNNPAFVNSPLRHVSNGLGGVRQRLDAERLEFSFPIMDDLRAEGATDYVAMPLVFSDGQINVLTLTCDHPRGFTTANLGLIFEVSGVLSRYFEVFTQRDNSRALLDTYLGQRTGGRVLGGEIRRGDGDEIDAAILFCDLRDSTGHEERLDRTAYLDLLNTFFETTAGAITDHGGEVLKFIGDAVLAVFPADGGADEACRRAAASAGEIVERLDATQAGLACAIGAAFGTVTYGNVGSRERLDFTVIGSAANIAARLAEWGKGAGTPIVVTGEVAECAETATALGPATLRNVADPVEAFAIASPG